MTILEKEWSLPTKQIDEIIRLLNENKNNPNTKDESVYYHMRRCQLLELAGSNRLIRKLDEKQKSILIILPVEDIFDEINNCH